MILTLLSLKEKDHLENINSYSWGKQREIRKQPNQCWRTGFQREKVLLPRNWDDTYKDKKKKREKRIKPLNYLQQCIQGYNHITLLSPAYLSHQIIKCIHQEPLIICICCSCWFYSSFQKSLSLLFILIIYHFAWRRQAPRAQKKIRESSFPQGYFFSLILRDLIEFFSVSYYFTFIIHILFIYFDL